MSIDNSNQMYDSTFFEAMKYLINKLESRYNSILTFNKLLDSSDSPNSLFSIKKELKLLFNDLQEDFRQGIFTIKALTKYNKNILDELKIKEKENENLTEQLNSILSENKNLKLKIIKSIENIPQIKMDSSKKDLNLNLKENLDNNENVHEEENYQRKNYFNINMRNNEKEVEKFKKNNYELDQLSNVKNIMDNMKKNKLKLKNAIEQHFINTKNIDNEN